MNNDQVGVLLVNLGTPDSPEVPAVRRYLKQFLNDPYVIDIPALARWALLNLIILPLRPKKSAHAYRSIWTERGSPLMSHSVDLTAKMSERLKDYRAVELGMRYGSPSLRAALEKLRRAGCRDLVVVPLYPQYALSSTETATAQIDADLKAMNWAPKVQVVAPFFDRPEFIEAVSAKLKPRILQLKPDHLMLSFHGLPERHIRKTDPAGTHCFATPTCCERMTTANRDCYRSQCYETARRICQSLGLPWEKTTVSFQSRLGRTPWIQPYTDLELENLPKAGIKRLMVACPSFVSDCLETLEEIEIRASESFRAAGGERLDYVAAVNSDDLWAEGLERLIRDTHGKGGTFVPLWRESR